jgi:hypothetical protein
MLQALPDNVLGGRPLSIEPTAQLSPSDDRTVLAGSGDEGRHNEQLGQGEAVGGFHPSMFGVGNRRRKMTKVPTTDWQAAR